MTAPPAPEGERRHQRVLGWIADSLVAAVVLTFLETAHVLAWWPGERSAGALAGIVWLMLGLMGLLGAIAGPALLLAVAAAMRFQVLAAWRADMVRGGEARVAALVRAAVAVSALAVFAGFTFVLAAWANRAFLEARPIALVESVALSVFIVIAALVAVEVAARLAGRASRSAALVEWSGGKVGLIVLAVSLVLAALALPVVAQRAAPDGELARPATAACWFLLLLIVMRAARPRLTRRVRAAARAIAVVSALAAVTVPLGLRWADAGRHAVWSRGDISRTVAVRVFAAFDRDGDGFASAVVGGPDCDDGDAGTGPLAPDLPGNGRDENCNGSDAPPRAPVAAAASTPNPSRPNVLLVTIDAVRVDHLGAWGYKRPTSPRLDALAARSTRFAWALTSTPTTRWALRSIALGRYSSSFGWVDGGATARRTKAPALGESFAAAGYDTRNIMCCPWPPDMAEVVHAGVAQVDQPAASPREKSKRFNGEQVAARVAAFLSSRRGATRPFFVWTHLIDPHNPYERRPGAPDFGDGQLDRYDSEIAYADARLGAILDALERSGLARSTIVAVASDHGEEFGDHGRRFHGASLYNEALRVPLIVHLPGAPARVVDTPVSLVDIAPTLADLAGVTAPAGASGRSLAAAVRGTGPAPQRPILAEVIPDEKITGNLLAVMSGCDKLIWDRQANVFELYSRCADPGDRDDRAASEPQVLERMRQLMAARVDADLAAATTSAK
jgi:choline-sulfatase